MAAALHRAGITVAACAALGLAGCIGGDDQALQERDAGAPEPLKRVDSAESFEGERRSVAEAVERFEAAIRRGDRRALCERVLVVRGDEFGTRRYDASGVCRRDPEFAPAHELRESGVEAGSYELAVERVTIAPREDRFKPDAVAFVRMPPGSANPSEVFELQQIAGEWRIYARYASRAGEEPDVFRMTCPDGSPSSAWSTDLISVPPDRKPATAQRALLRRPGPNEIADERRPPGRLKWVEWLGRAQAPRNLVRVAIGYGYAHATYELRNDGGEGMALYDLQRFDGQYFNWAQSACPRMLRVDAGLPVVPDDFVSSRAASDAGRWHVDVRVTAPAYGRGPVALGVDDLTVTDEGGSGPWITHDLVLHNKREGRITIADSRTSEFAEPSAFADSGERLIVAMEGCGFALNRRGGPARPGACRLYREDIALAPGQTKRHRISVFKGLAEMDPLIPGEYVFRHSLRFKRGDRAPEHGEGSREGFQLAYLVTRSPE